LTDRHQLDT